MTEQTRLKFQVRDPGGQVLAEANTKKAAKAIAEDHPTGEVWAWSDADGGYQPVDA